MFVKWHTEKCIVILSIIQIKYLCSFPLYLFCSVLQRDHMKIAQQFFQLVGGSASECGMSQSVLLKTIYNWSWARLTSGVWLSRDMSCFSIWNKGLELERKAEDVAHFVACSPSTRKPLGLISSTTQSAHDSWYL